MLLIKNFVYISHILFYNIIGDSMEFISGLIFMATVIFILFSPLGSYLNKSDNSNLGFKPTIVDALYYCFFGIEMAIIIIFAILNRLNIIELDNFIGEIGVYIGLAINGVIIWLYFLYKAIYKEDGIKRILWIIALFIILVLIIVFIVKLPDIMY